MNDIRELIGQKVTVMIHEDEEGNTTDIECEVIDVNIIDYYFEDKGEPIYVTVNVEPIGDYPKGFDEDYFVDIALENIRKN